MKNYINKIFSEYTMEFEEPKPTYLNRTKIEIEEMCRIEGLTEHELLVKEIEEYNRQVDKYNSAIEEFHNNLRKHGVMQL